MSVYQTKGELSVFVKAVSTVKRQWVSILVLGIEDPTDLSATGSYPVATCWAGS